MTDSWEEKMPEEKCERNARSESRRTPRTRSQNGLAEAAGGGGGGLGHCKLPRGGKYFILHPIDPWKSYSHGIKIQIAANTIKLTQPWLNSRQGPKRQLTSFQAHDYLCVLNRKIPF